MVLERLFSGSLFLSSKNLLKYSETSEIKHLLFVNENKLHMVDKIFVTRVMLSKCVTAIPP